MSFLTLARKNAWRKPLRTLMLIFCVAVAFLIYGLTGSFLAGTQGTSGASEDLLGVMNAAGRTQSLPMAYLPRIAAMPGVAAVSYSTRLRGFVDVERNVVAISAVDAASMAKVSGKELGLTPELIAALGRSGDKVLVGRALAQAQGWTVGQHITVTAFHTRRKDGDRTWPFEIAGIFDGENASTDTYFILANYSYVNRSRAAGENTVDVFALRPEKALSPGVLAARIDALFANTAQPTRTQSEKQFLEAFLRQYADVGLIINLVTGAAFITLLMIIINTMVFAIRERSFEIGVLKTLGFSQKHILLLVLGETLLIFAAGGALGLGLAKLATVATGPLLGLVFSFEVLAKGVVIALFFGLATGLLPAIGAMRTPISKAFRVR